MHLWELCFLHGRCRHVFEHDKGRQSGLLMVFTPKKLIETQITKSFFLCENFSYFFIKNEMRVYGFCYLHLTHMNNWGHITHIAILTCITKMKTLPCTFHYQTNQFFSRLSYWSATSITLPSRPTSNHGCLCRIGGGQLNVESSCQEFLRLLRIIFEIKFILFFKSFRMYF